MKKLSAVGANVAPSQIRAFFELATKSKNVVSLAIGEPDFNTPQTGINAALAALAQGRTHYTSNKGEMTLLQSIARYYKMRFGIDYDAESDVMTTIGASEALDLAFRVLLNKGDEVLIPAPTYVAYRPIVELNGGVAVSLPCAFEDNWTLAPDAVKKALTPKTKAIVIPYPNNPTGAVMPKDKLAEIAKLLADADVYAVSDEIYNELYFGEDGFCSIASFPEMKNRTVVVNGFSKAFAMTGWRLGYALANAEIIDAMTRIREYTTICAPTLSQMVGIALLDEAMATDFATLAEMRQKYNERRLYVAERLNKMGVRFVMPDGAFYFYPNVSDFCQSDFDFALTLLKDFGVATVPGRAFGEQGKGFVRLSYTNSPDNIAEAMDRMEKYVNFLKNH